MADEINPAKSGAETITLNVRLKANGQDTQPVLANYSTLGIAQNIAYIDFGFIEPAVLAAVAKSAQRNGAVPKNLEGQLATRVALPMDAVRRLHQQLTQVLTGLHKGRSSNKA